MLWLILQMLLKVLVQNHSFKWTSACIFGAAAVYISWYQDFPSNVHRLF